MSDADTADTVLGEENGGGEMPNPLLFTVQHWLTRQLPPPDFLLGDLLSTTSRVMLIGPTGIGKSNFGLGISFAIASGTSFLRWKARRSARVLYIDGEMSNRLIKDRVQQAVDRHGHMPETLWIVTREDFPDMPPLNDEKGEGKEFIERLVGQLGGVDLIVFDNIQALVAGSLKEDVTWAPVLPWIRKLTAMKIGQVWLHHTGHATDRGYGDKAREWQFDVVALMKALQTPTPGRLLEFRLEFTKARERSPDNRTEFELVNIWIDEHGAWQATTSPAKTDRNRKRGLTAEYLKALDHLSDAMAEHGEFVTANGIPPETRVVHLNHWRDRLKLRGLHEDGNAGKQWFYRVRKALIAQERIVIDGLYVWPLKP
jgi:hypothetical protein